jgi:hypothetical protein
MPLVLIVEMAGSTLALQRDQAGVAWTHYQLRKAALEAAVTLGAAARALVARIAAAPVRALPCLGAELYRIQRAGAAITPAEWQRVWPGLPGGLAPRRAGRRRHRRQPQGR